MILVAALFLATFSQTVRSDRVWLVVNGSCQIDAEEPECVMSPNYPNNYGNNEYCEMRLLDDTMRWVDTTAFDVELCCDYISIGTRHFNGRASGTLRGLYFNDTVFWTSDYSVNYTGWRFCAREMSQRSSVWWSANAIASSSSSSDSSGMDNQTTDVVAKLVDLVRASRLWLALLVLIGASVAAKQVKDGKALGEPSSEKPNANAVQTVLGSAASPTAAAPPTDSDRKAPSGELGCPDHPLGSTTVTGRSYKEAVPSASKPGLEE
eukprot:CAMPEP_0206488530 /NCGR_PEP_ID=MMETSP0324_2-20121206/42486_1 /ASSEMBLY_ACC=CAM_ASM_000836 /TAXON_ID=2866 /ORGANISM="Crypthecodinium cohnii, Strain Seligo" /LENGTH=264 /DNA_ID=CAMNT_0053967609 /DNA_START=27 /DNA_END=818 /DNA_ORIENTATION=+